MHPLSPTSAMSLMVSDLTTPDSTGIPMSEFSSPSGDTNNATPPVPPVSETPVGSPLPEGIVSPEPPSDSEPLGPAADLQSLPLLSPLTKAALESRYGFLLPWPVQ